MTGWDACTMESSAILRWMECHPGFAGYVQAVGTIGAVVIALYAPRIAAYFSRRANQEERRTRTLILVQSLGTPTIDVGVEADRIKRELEDIRKLPPDSGAWPGWFEKKLLLKPPLQFEYLHQHLADTDPELTRVFRQVAESVVSYNSIRAQTANFPQTIAQSDWFNVWRGLAEAIDRVRDAVANASLTYIPSV
jgi:hypothetical protein